MKAFTDVARALRTLWVGGCGHGDPELARDVEEALEAARRLGADGLAGAIVELQEALAGADASAVFRAQLQVWVRLRGVQRGLQAQDLRSRLAKGPAADDEAAPDGWTGTFHPLGALIVPPKVHIHGLDDEGGWRTFAERSVAVDPYDAYGAPWISRLFQAELVLGTTLGRRWQATEHPGVTTAKRWVGRPAFGTRPRRLSNAPAPPELPALQVADRHGIGRAEVVAERGRDGWTVRSGGHDVRRGACLLFNLEKLAAMEGPVVRRDAVLLAASGERVVLQWGSPPSFPTLEPGACTWRSAAVRARLTGGWGAVVRAMAPEAFGVSAEEALVSMDGFPLAEDDVAQAFWRQWAAARLGRSSPPAPALVAELRGAAAGEPVDAERLLQALWSLEQGGGLDAERAVLLPVAVGRPVARDGDVLEAVLQARLARHARGGGHEVDEAALAEGFRGRIDEELRAVHRRLGADGVLPSLVELFWLADAHREAHGDGAPGVGRLHVPVEALDRALVAVLGPWLASGDPSSISQATAWAVLAESGRVDNFIGE